MVMDVAELVKLGKQELPISGKRPASKWVQKGHTTKGTKKLWMQDPDCTGIALKLGDLVVIDIDNKKSSMHFTVEDVSQHVLKTLGIKETFIVASGSGKGSCHIYFQVENNMILNRRKLRSDLKSIKCHHIDVLSNNQYVVLPGSTYLSSNKQYTIFDNSKPSMLPEQYMIDPDVLIIDESQRKYVDDDIPVSKYLLDTHSRHKSIMREAMFILAVTDNTIKTSQLAEILQERTSNSPCGTKTLFWDEINTKLFYEETAKKAIQCFIPNKSSEMIADWSEQIHLLSKHVSNSALVLAVSLLKEFRKEGSHVMHRSYRQIASKVLNLSTVQRARKELEAYGFIIWKRHSLIKGTYSQWTLNEPPSTSDKKQMNIDISDLAFTSRRTGGLGIQSALILQSITETAFSKLSDIAEYSQNVWNTSKDTKNLLSYLKRNKIIEKSDNIWIVNSFKLKEISENPILKKFIVDKKNLFATQREDYLIQASEYKHYINIGLEQFREGKYKKFPVRYSTIEKKCLSLGLKKHHIITVWLEMKRQKFYQQTKTE